MIKGVPGGARGEACLIDAAAEPTAGMPASDSIQAKTRATWASIALVSAARSVAKGEGGADGTFQSERSALTSSRHSSAVEALARSERRWMSSLKGTEGTLVGAGEIALACGATGAAGV